jgi:hypothetical protein
VRIDFSTRLTVAAATCSLALALTGCGGGSDGKNAVNGHEVAQAKLGAGATTSTGAQPSAARPGAAGSVARPHRRARASAARRRAHRHHRPRRPAGSAKPRSGQKALVHHLSRSSRARRSYVSSSAPALLRLLGFKHAQIAVDRTGRIVTVTIPTSEACGHPSSVEQQIRHRIRKGFRFVRRVDVLTGGQAFSSYNGAHCKALAPPDVAGKLVYSASGNSGSTITPSFRIVRSHWTVAYENDSTFFSVFLIKDGKYESQNLTIQSPDVGKQTFHGKGTFKLRISAAGTWRVKVYD